MGLRFSYHRVMNGFENKVLNFIKEQEMTKPGDMIVVGFSGGADSTALLTVLWELRAILKISLTAVHVEHGIRQDSMADADFAGDFCRERGIDFVLVREDVPAIAAAKHLTEEEAGRKVRYSAFDRIVKEKGGSRIAVAHHENDVAETLLFNLIRGSSLHGGASIRPVRDNIIRPLLCVSRKEIEEYLAGKCQSYCTDSTNLENIHHRNIIRNRILPLLEKELNPRATEHLARAAEDFRQADLFVQKAADEVYDRIVSADGGKLSFDRAELLARPEIIGRNLVLKCIEQLSGSVKDISFAHISSVLDLAKTDGGCGMVNLPYGITARRVYDRIEFYIPGKDISAEPGEIPIEAGNEETQIEIPVLGKVAIQVFPYKNQTNIPTDAYTKWFDYDRIHSVVFRTRRPGDVIAIEQGGELRFKQLSKFMTDVKIPVYDRDRLYILADGDQVIWVPGYRMSGAYKVSKTTGNVLAVNVIDGGNLNG